MKSVIQTSLAIALILGAAANLNAAAPTAGHIDLGKFALAESGSEIVDVTIGSNLISMATRITGKHEPEVSDLLKGLEFIQVKVVGIKQGNQAVIEEKVEAIRSELDAIGWERVVSSKKGREDVAIFVKTRGDESIQGLVVTVLQAKREAVFVNIVGDIKPEQIAMLGDRFNIEPLKKVGRGMEKR